MDIIDNLKKTGDAVERALSPTKDGEMDILKKLKMEHDEVKDLLKKLVDEDTPASERKTVLTKIKTALVPHERAEEKVVYNAIISQKEEKPKMDGKEGYLEHNLADKTLAKLTTIEDATSPDFNATAKVLKELLEHHISEEESNVWKDVREHFDSEERMAMNREFEDVKKTIRAA